MEDPVTINQIVEDRVRISLNNTTVEIIVMAPPSQIDNGHVRSIAGFYFFLFVLGLCGIVSTATAIYGARQKLRLLNSHNIRVYFFTLCGVDFLVLSTVPLTISRMMLGTWMFGDVTCKIYWIFDSLGKVLPSYVLSVMSFERYLSICHPNRGLLRSKRSCLTLLGMMGLIAVGLLAPLSVTARETEHFTAFVTTADGIACIRTTVCGRRGSQGSRQKI